MRSCRPGVYFRAAAPKGIKAAKIYKVLHLMRPEMFPILDSRLAARYELGAKQAAKAVNGCRPDLPASKYAYWATIRQDVLTNTKQRVTPDAVGVGRFARVWRRSEIRNAAGARPATNGPVA